LTPPRPTHLVERGAVLADPLSDWLSGLAQSPVSPVGDPIDAAELLGSAYSARRYAWCRILRRLK